MMRDFLYRILITYLRALARLQLMKNAADVIGITGSAGKTSCMHAVAAILQDKYRLKVGYKANSELGIPLNILDLHVGESDSMWVDLLKNIFLAPWSILTNWRRYDKYLVEMGVDGPEYPKNMSYLLTIVQPRTAIFLNAEAVHSELYDFLVGEKDPDKRREAIRGLIAHEKGKLISSLPENGLAILNADDPYVAAVADKTKARVMWFGKRGVKVTRVQPSLTGTTFVFEYEGTAAILTLDSMLLGTAYGHTFAAALCVALDEGMTLPEGCDLLHTNFRLPPGRMNLIAGVNGSTLIDSSYNASLAPMLDAVQLLQQVPGRRKIVILGDMRELGAEAAMEHEALARAVEWCDEVHLVGPLMRAHALPLLAQREEGVSWHVSARAAANAVRPHLKKGDVVLIKGSQNTLLLEIAVEALMLHPKQADTLLARRGKFWDVKRLRLQ